MVKGNQATLQKELQETILQALGKQNPDLRRCNKMEQNRNRRENREVTVMPVPKNSAVFARWPGVKTIGSSYRTRELHGKRESSMEMFILSLPCKVRMIGAHLRAHWSIENSQHHIRDVTFTEDASRIRKGNGPEISSVFRRLALNILQQDTTIKDNIRGKRKRYGWNEQTLEQLIAGFSEK